jgi:hypothetical protein
MQFVKPAPGQPAKVTPFAGGKEAAVRKSAAGDFFQYTSERNACVARRHVRTDKLRRADP